jgi:hypothetical protein
LNESETISEVNRILTSWITAKSQYKLLLLMHHKDHMGFLQPLKNIHHQNIALPIKSSNNTKGHTFKANSMKNPPTQNITTCNARHHHIQAIRTYHNLTNRTPPIGHTTKQLYNDLTLSNANTNINKKNIAHKIKL